MTRATCATSLISVSVNRHRSGGRLLFTVDTFDGEGGTQSDPFYTYTDALAEARRLAVEIGGELEA